MDEMVTDKKAMLIEILKSDKNLQIKEAIEEFPPAMVVEVLMELESQKVIHFLKLLDYEDAGRIYSYFPIDFQYQLFPITEKKFFAEVFAHMYSDTRADLFQYFKKEEQIALLPYLDKSTREDVIILSAYDKNTAGGFMSTDFATILIHMSCEEAIKKIRKDAPSQKMIYYIYVVNDEMEMLGIITLKDLIMASPHEIVQDLYNDHFIHVNVNDDKEDVAKTIEKHDLVAVPVLNDLNQLVGIVSHEEAIDIIRAEHKEDMEKFMGIVPSSIEHPYFSTKVTDHFKQRVTWLVSLAAVGFISGVIIHHFQLLIEHIIILAIYMPMMTATGGNTGSQAATVIIRAIALGQVHTRDWFRVIWMEFRVSFLLSACVGLLVLLKITYFSSVDQVHGSYSFGFLGLVVAGAMAIQVISSAIIGATLPMLVYKLGGDPAVAASPAITTTVDVTGLLIYFNIASLALDVHRNYLP